jgi:L-serine/L-threonine ammonia-lyase
MAIPVVVVVPETTSERAKALIQQEGAEVIVHGSSWQESDELARSMVKDSDTYLHPFDDPLVWQGHATMIDEVAVSGVKPGVVIVSVGGGGLYCGIVEGLHRNGWSDVPVIVTETEGADSLARSVEAGRLVELDAITSLATTLGARKVCQQALTASQTHPTRSRVVSDRAAVLACERFLADHRILVEPACGASLVIVYDSPQELDDFESALIIVCGGATTTIEQLQTWSEQLA